MISANLSAIFYLISGILFILALRGLSSPDTSRQGNYFGIAGMIIAIVVTFLSVGNFSTSLVYVIIILLRDRNNVRLSNNFYRSTFSKFNTWYRNFCLNLLFMCLPVSEYFLDFNYDFFSSGCFINYTYRW